MFLYSKWFLLLTFFSSFPLFHTCFLSKSTHTLPRLPPVAPATSYKNHNVLSKRVCEAKIFSEDFKAGNLISLA